MKLTNLRTQKILVENIMEAKTFGARLKGLMFTKVWPKNQTLWIKRCNSIHTCFMKFSIDVVFVDKNLIVKDITRNIQPWKITVPVWSASSVFEFTAGTFDDSQLQVGDQLHVGT